MSPSMFNFHQFLLNIFAENRMFYSSGDDYYENTNAVPSLSTSSPLTPSATTRPLQPPIGSSISGTRTATASVQNDYHRYRQDVQRKPMVQSGGNLTGAIRNDLSVQMNNGGGRLPTLNGATVVNGINLANLKFVKPALQCFYWEDSRHRAEQPNCRLWHPRELCKYYPKCTLSAEVCGFGHPFCGEYCTCEPTDRSLQKNHRVIPPSPTMACNGFQQQQQLDDVWKNTVNPVNVDYNRKNGENDNKISSYDCGQANAVGLNLSPQRLTSPPLLPIFRHQQQQLIMSPPSLSLPPPPLPPRPTPPQASPPLIFQQSGAANGQGGESKSLLFTSPPPLLANKTRQSSLTDIHNHQRTASLPPPQPHHHHQMLASTHPSLRHAATLSHLQQTIAKSGDGSVGATTTVAQPTFFGGGSANGGNGSGGTGQSNARVPTLNGATVVNGINLANLKFVKPAPQCFYWEDSRHRAEQPNCRLWHPRELCKYYPKCTLSAEVCGFGHPFCGKYCTCEPTERSLQKNHRVVSSARPPNFMRSPPTTDTQDDMAATTALSSLRQLI